MLAINTPPLRKRLSVIPLLADHFLSEAEKRSKCSRKRRVEKEAITVLSNYPWPGNVRQLRHVVEKLVATTMDGDSITAEAVRRALPNGHLAGARAQVPLLYHENDSLEAFLDRTLLTLYEQLLATTEITVKLRGCYALIVPHCINDLNEHGDACRVVKIEQLTEDASDSLI